MAADRQHLHHRVLNIGHSYRQSVLIMYLWAALFSVTVVSLSVVRTRLVVFVVATAVAVLTLLPVTMPRLRPWRLLRGPQATPAVARRGTVAAAAARGPVPAAAHRGTVPAAYRGTAAAVARHGIRQGTPRPAGPVLNGAPSSGAAPNQHAPFPGPLPAPPFPAAAPLPEATRYPDAAFPDAPFPDAQFPHDRFQGDQFAADPLPRDQFPGDQLPRAGRLPGVDPVAPFASAYPVDPLGPGPASNGRQPHPDPFTAPDPFPSHGPAPAAGPAPAGPAPAGPAESPDPLAPPQHRDAQPW